MNYDDVSNHPRVTGERGSVTQSMLHGNLFLRVGESLTHEKRMYVQTIEGNDYNTPYHTYKSQGVSIALAVLEVSYEDDGTEAATLEARAMELLRQARTKRVQEMERIEKLDPEVAEYRKTELTANPITAKRFVEWEKLDDSGKQSWRDRYAAVVELFKKKFDVGQNVEAVSEWEDISFRDLKAGDKIRVMVDRDFPCEYRTVTHKDGTYWATDGSSVSPHVDYYSIQRKVG